MEDLLRAVGRVEGKVDLILLQNARTEEAAKELENRVRTLEGRTLYFAGFGAAVGVGMNEIGRFLKLWGSQ